MNYWLVLLLLALPLYPMSKLGLDTFYILVPIIIFMQIYLVKKLKNALVDDKKLKICC